MNVLKRDKQEAAIAALVEGASIRSVERMTGIHRDTIMRLGYRVGQGCANLMDSYMQNLKCQNVQVDEIWCFVGKKPLSPKKKRARGFLPWPSVV